MDQVTDRNSIERAPARQPGRPAWKIGAIAIALVAIAGAGIFHGSVPQERSGGAPPAAPALPVTVSKPLQRNVDVRLGFLGQFSAVNRVELRAQVGGILTEIHFQDGQIVHKGDLLFVIDPRPYEIKLAEAKAQLQTATSDASRSPTPNCRARSRSGTTNSQPRRRSTSAPTTRIRRRPRSKTPRRGSATPNSIWNIAASPRPSPAASAPARSRSAA